MFKSSEVTYLKPSNFDNKSYIFGTGKGFLLSHLSSSLKSEMKRPVPFFLRIMKVRTTIFESFLRFKTQILNH